MACPTPPALSAPSRFGWGNDVADDAGVVDDVEVEAPVAGNSRLPDVPGLIVFLGVSGWAVEVMFQKPDLLEKGPPYGGRLPRIGCHSIDPLTLFIIFVVFFVFFVFVQV
jgi:hypothetical protein